MNVIGFLEIFGSFYGSFRGEIGDFQNIFGEIPERFFGHFARFFVAWSIANDPFVCLFVFLSFLFSFFFGGWGTNLDEFMRSLDVTENASNITTSNIICQFMHLKSRPF